MPQAGLPAGDVALKIAVLPAWYPTPEQPMSGVFVRDHARAAALHHEVAIIAPQAVRERPGVVAPSPSDELRTVRVRYRLSTVPLGAGLACTRGVLAALNNLDRAGFRPDLIHAHVHEIGLAAMIAGRRYGVPVVLSEHSSHFSLGTLTASARRRALLVSRGVDLICPVSEDLARRMRAAGVRGRFEVVPNPVDSEVFTPSPPPPPAPPRALFLGGLHPVKQVDLLLRALASGGRDDLRLDLVGDGPCRAALERLADELGVSERVQFWGYQPREEVVRRVRAAHFLVMTSAVETFGIALVEALSAGRPVVAVRVGAIPEIVDEGRGLLVPAGDERALADALRRMADEHTAYDWQALSAGVRAQFGLAAIGERWDAVYRSLAC